MTGPGDDVERLLREALDARARSAVGDERPVPPLRPDGLGTVAPHRPRRRWTWLAPLAAAAAVIAVVVGATGVLHRAAPSSQAGPATRGPATSGRPSASSAAPATAVHIRMKFGDGARFGVGIPVIAYFSRQITDARALQRATVVTVDGKPASGAWYFEPSTGQPGYPLEGDFRLESYWPAHATIKIAAPAKGLSAGNGLVFADDLALNFSTGAANVATVNDVTHKLTLRSDGRVAAVYPVSLGAPATPTTRGTKVIMDKGADVCMSGPGYHTCGIKWTQQLTDTGEYLHSAPWNKLHIRAGIDSSNGCTNLMPADAAKLYRVLEVGDVVQYPNADGPEMTMGLGYGDWNVPWSRWLTGGAVPTH